MADRVAIDQATKDEYYPGQSFSWEQNPLTGAMTEVPAYVDYINPDGTPHINYDYWQGVAAPTIAGQQQAAVLNADRMLQVNAQQGMFNPLQQAVQAQAWRPTWIQF